MHAHLNERGVGVPCWWLSRCPSDMVSVPTTFLDKSFSTRFQFLQVIGAVNMSSSDKIPTVLGSPSATDAKEVAGAATVAATVAEATEASESDAVVTGVAAAGDGAAPKVAAPKVAAGGRYSDAAVAAMTEHQLRTAVLAGLLTSGQMTRALQQFGLEAKTPKDLQAWRQAFRPRARRLRMGVAGTSADWWDPCRRRALRGFIARDSGRVHAAAQGGVRGHGRRGGGGRVLRPRDRARLGQPHDHPQAGGVCPEAHGQVRSVGLAA